MNIIENAMEVSILLLVFSSMVYNRNLKRTKWKRKLTKGETIMYLLTSIAIPLYAVSYLLLIIET